MTLFNVVLGCLVLCGSYASEPKCSKFDYDERTLEKVIRMELTMERLLAENKEVEQRTADILNTMQQERQDIKQTMEQERQNMQEERQAMQQTMEKERQTLQEERQAMQQTMEQERQNMHVGHVVLFF